MKKFFTRLLLVAMFSTTPFVFTSCGDLFGMLDEIMQELEEETGDGDDEEYDESNEDYYEETPE